MNRGDILTDALQVVGDQNLTTEARIWLNNALYELEGEGYFTFLQSSTTHQTVNDQVSAAFTASEWPSAALTTFSKGLEVVSGTPARKLLEVQKPGFDAMSDGATGAPRFFSLWNQTLFLYPTPVTGAQTLPLLTVYFFRKIVVPTDDSDELDAVAGANIPLKYHKYLVNAVAFQGLRFTGDDREDRYRQIWESNILEMKKDNADYANHV